MSMDSATSESFQSSNGGADFDDFDSRPPPDPISPFLNLPPPQPPPIPQTSRALFDPFPSYHTNSFLSDLDATTWPPPPSLPLHPPSSAPPAASSSVAAAPRFTKKRARASRRAPTTVLTTDTSNFRAMVQEFTGIPAPPFATSSVFSRPRLDLFHHSASASPPGFLLRPFAQKRQATGPSASMAGISSNTLPSSTSSIQSQNFLLGGQNPSLSLQSLLQEQQRAMAPLCQWPTGGGYGGGELGSVIACASAETDSKRIGGCKADHTGSSSDKQAAAEGFLAAAAAPARAEGGVDAWQLPSD